MQNERTTRLLDLAQKEFGSLSATEKLLFRSFTQSEAASYLSAASAADNNPAKAHKWGSERTVGATRISWLCRNPEASALGGTAGLQIVGARIEGPLDLSYAKVPFPLVFVNCAFSEWIYLRNAEIQEIVLNGSRTGPILAGLLKVAGSAQLKGVSTTGEVDLIGGVIGGNLDLSSASINKKDGYTLKAEGIRVKGSVLLPKFVSEGEILFNRSAISGDLQCDHATFINQGKSALTAQGIMIGGSISFRDGFQSEGTIDLRGADIAKYFESQGASFRNKDGVALAVEGMIIGGNAFLEGVMAEGRVTFANSIIKGQFECEKAEFRNEGGISFFANGIAAREFFFRNVHSQGEVSLNGAIIGGNLEFDKSHLINPKGQALVLENVQARNIYLRNGFTAEGRVSLLNTAVGGDLSCTKGRFINKEGECLIAENLTVGGRVSVRDAETKGLVSFAHAKINGHFIWLGMVSPAETTLDLRWAKIRAIWDDDKSWPLKDHLWLNGLTYEEFDSRSPTNLETRSTWLKLQLQGRFYPQPYEQLAAVFMKEGRDDDAKQVQIMKNEDQALLSQMSFFERSRHRLHGSIIGYGHSPWRALWWMLVFFVLGVIFFHIGYATNAMTPSKEPGFSQSNGAGSKIVSPDIYPKFNAIIYSLDMFLPLVDLHLKHYWLPNANHKIRKQIWSNFEVQIPWGAFLRVYLIMHILAGWILTTLFVAGLTGLIKK